MKMALSFLGSQEHTSGITNNIDTSITPLNVLGVLFVEKDKLLAVDLEIGSILLDSAVESSVDGIILKLINEIVQIHEGFIDGKSLDVGVVDGGSEDESTDSSETVNTEVDDAHGFILVIEN